jgi:hypothetical protein
VARSARRIREQIIANAVSGGIVAQIDAAVAGVSGISPAATDVPLMSISLADLRNAAARPAASSTGDLISDETLLGAVRALAQAEDALAHENHRYVRATKIAAHLRITTSSIRRKLRSLELSGRLVTIGKAAGKRYAALPGDPS